jgi:hypothetical protein
MLKAVSSRVAMGRLSPGIAQEGSQARVRGRGLGVFLLFSAEKETRHARPDCCKLKVSRS